MKKHLLSLVFLLCIVFASQAQKNEWGIGVRGGEPSGLTIKKYFGGGANALDISFGYNGYIYNRGRKYWHGEYRRSVALLVNYLWHKPISGANGFELYFGFGAKVSSRRYWHKDDDFEDTTMAFGVDGVIGAEYFIPNVPVSFFVELDPYFEFVPVGWFWFDGGGGIRFNF